MKHKKYFLTILSAFFLTNLVIAQIKIPVRKVNGVSIINCSINGVKLDFIFDTGASEISISKTEAMFLLKNNHLVLSDFLGYEKAQIANGEIIENTKILIREIKIGNYTIENVKANIVDNENAPLLLGQNIVNKFSKVELLDDYIIFTPKKKYQYKNKMYFPNKLVFKSRNKLFTNKTIYSELGKTNVFTNYSEYNSVIDDYQLVDLNRNGRPELYSVTSCGGTGCPPSISVFEENSIGQFEFVSELKSEAVGEYNYIFTDRIEIINFGIFRHLYSCGACYYRDLPYEVPYIQTYVFKGDKIQEDNSNDFYNTWLLKNLEFLKNNSPANLENEWDNTNGFRKAFFTELYKLYKYNNMRQDEIKMLFFEYYMYSDKEIIWNEQKDLFTN